MLHRASITTIDHGSTTLHATDQLLNGDPLDLPMTYVVGTARRGT